MKTNILKKLKLETLLDILKLAILHIENLEAAKRPMLLWYMTAIIKVTLLRQNFDMHRLPGELDPKQIVLPCQQVTYQYKNDMHASFIEIIGQYCTDEALRLELLQTVYGAVEEKASGTAQVLSAEGFPVPVLAHALPSPGAYFNFYPALLVKRGNVDAFNQLNRELYHQEPAAAGTTPAMQLHQAILQHITCLVIGTVNQQRVDEKPTPSTDVSSADVQRLKPTIDFLKQLKLHHYNSFYLLSEFFYRVLKEIKTEEDKQGKEYSPFRLINLIESFLHDANAIMDGTKELTRDGTLVVSILKKIQTAIETWLDAITGITLGFIHWVIETPNGQAFETDLNSEPDTRSVLQTLLALVHLRPAMIPTDNKQEGPTPLLAFVLSLKASHLSKITNKCRAIDCILSIHGSTDWLNSEEVINAFFNLIKPLNPRTHEESDTFFYLAQHTQFRELFIRNIDRYMDHCLRLFNNTELRKKRQKFINIIRLPFEVSTKLSPPLTYKAVYTLCKTRLEASTTPNAKGLMDEYLTPIYKGYQSKATAGKRSATEAAAVDTEFRPATDRVDSNAVTDMADSDDSSTETEGPDSPSPEPPSAKRARVTAPEAEAEPKAPSHMPDPAPTSQNPMTFTAAAATLTITQPPTTGLTTCYSEDGILGMFAPPPMAIPDSLTSGAPSQDGINTETADNLRRLEEFVETPRPSYMD